MADKIHPIAPESAGQAAHVAIADYLRQQITSGALAPKQLIESESALCERFSVSRGPVRQALSALNREGLIHRIAGKGSFVSERVRAANLSQEVTSIRVVVDCGENMLRESWFIEIVDQLTRAVSHLPGRCRLAFNFHPFTGDLDIEATELLSGEGCHGVLVIPLSHSSMEFMARWRPTGRPLVAFYRQVASSAFSQIYVDQEAGAYRAVQYLIRHGHRQIGFLTPTREHASVAAEQREAGYRKALEAEGLGYDPDLVVQTEFFPGDIRDQCLDLFQRSNRPTALLIGGSSLLKAAQQAVFETELKIPEELSVITFDDVPDAIEHVPSLTAVKMPVERAARRALEQLITEIRRAGTPTISLGFTSELVIRDSCAICEAGGANIAKESL